MSRDLTFDLLPDSYEEDEDAYPQEVPETVGERFAVEETVVIDGEEQTFYVEYEVKRVTQQSNGYPSIHAEPTEETIRKMEELFDELEWDVSSGYYTWPDDM